jgi:hypothetical protein
MPAASAPSAARARFTGLPACRPVVHGRPGFTLGERIERRLYDLLETLIEARYTKQRGELLREANRSLELLRYQVRLARELR